MNRAELQAMTRDDFITQGVWLVRTPPDCPDRGVAVDYYATTSIHRFLDGEWLANFAEAMRSARSAYLSLLADRAQLGADNLDPGLAVPDHHVIETCQVCENRRAMAWREAHWERDPWERCARFVRAIAAFPCDTTLTADQDSYIIHLLGAFHLTKFDFKRVDEHPSEFEVFGEFDRSDWHWKLRQVRNNPSNNLYDVLNANEDAGYSDRDIIPAIPFDFQGRKEI
jgi:hypothetical protein